MVFVREKSSNLSFLLPVPVRGKMNKINVLTLTNNNLVVCFFPDMDNINGTSVPPSPQFSDANRFYSIRVRDVTVICVSPHTYQ